MLFVIQYSASYEKKLASDWKHSKPSWFFQPLDHIDIPIRHTATGDSDNFLIYKKNNWPDTRQKVKQSSEISSAPEPESNTLCPSE